MNIARPTSATPCSFTSMQTARGEVILVDTGVLLWTKKKNQHGYQVDGLGPDTSPLSDPKLCLRGMGSKA